MACTGKLTMTLFIVSWSLSEAAAQSGPSDNKETSDYKMVKQLLESRNRYQSTLEGLRAHYIKVGDVERARWAETELRAWHRIPKHAFRLDMVVPAKSLKPLHNIPEANDLYRRAIAFKGQGWGNDALDNQKRAELLLLRLLAYYPESDKISDAAYQLGDIYENRPYRQYRRAALYFERVYHWDSNTQWDARLRAARIYDLKLSERDRAKELYRLVLKHETDAKRLQEASKRLGELRRQ